MSSRIALVGCGAVATTFHLPALAKRQDLIGSLMLVDRDVERARGLASQLGAAGAVADHRELIGRVDGAIITTPHRLHHPMTLDFVRAGVPVLCEKPLADDAQEVDEIVAASTEHGVPVAVNQTRRLFSSFQAVKRTIASGEIGEVTSIDYELGEPFQWPAATATYFGANAGGRGVLFDTGAHIVDLVCWWLGGEPEVIDYADDAHGGTEAVADITLRHGRADAHIRLSWLTKLRNTYRVVGTNGSIEGGIYEWSSFTRRDAGGSAQRVRTDSSSRDLSDFMDMLIANFAEVVAGRAAPLVSAADARAAIAVIDACYARRKPLPEPWHDACRRLIDA